MMNFREWFFKNTSAATTMKIIPHGNILMNYAAYNVQCPLLLIGRRPLESQQSASSEAEHLPI